jgi:hypothetical protein
MKNHPDVARDLSVPSTELMTEDHVQRMHLTQEYLNKNLLNESKI